MRRVPEHAFRKVEPLLEPGVYVAIVSSTSRTWYQDQATMYELLLYLAHFEAFVTVIGNSAVRYCAAVAAELSETYPVLSAQDSVDAELFVEACALCVALPARNSKEAQSASPFVEMALRQGTPVVAIWPNRDATYVTLDVE